MTDIAKTIEELKEKEHLSEQDLIALGIGIVPSVDGHEPIAPPLSDPIQMVDGSLMNYMHDHIHHWLNNYVYDRTINLPQEDKDRYFQMITDYGDIIAKLINDDNNVIYEYARGNPNPWLKLENHAAKSGMVIDFDKPKQLIKEYEEWRQRKGL